jgi:MFS family permease
MKKNTLIITLAIAISGLNYGILQIIFPLYVNHLGFSLASIGFVFTLAPFFFGTISLIFGTLSDSIGRRGFFMFASLISLTSCLILFFPNASLLALLALVQILFWSGRAMQYSVGQVIAMEPTNRNKSKGEFMGRFQGALTFGTGLGLLISGVLLSWLKYSSVFMIIGILYFVMFVFSLFLTERKKVREKGFSIRQTFSLKSAHRNIRVIFLSMISMGLGVGVAELFGFILFMNVVLRVDSSVLGIVIGGGWLLLSLPMIFSGKLADRSHNIRQYIGSSILSAAIFGVMYFANNVLTAIVVYLLYNFVQGFSFAPRLKITAEATGEGVEGRDMNIPILGQYFGIGLGAFIFGLISEAVGYHALFLIEAMFLGVSGLVGVLLKAN